MVKKKSKIKKPVRYAARKYVAKKKAARPRAKSPKVKRVAAKRKSTGSVKQPAAIGKNSNLGDAKTNKNDEFYTQWVDIEREMNAYLEYDPNVFRDKVVLLPCDDPEWSNFAKFFALHFMDYGIKKLIILLLGIGKNLVLIFKVRQISFKKFSIVGGSTQIK